MKRFSRWMNEVLPPKWVINVWVVAFLVLWMTPHLLAWTYGLTALELKEDMQFQKMVNLCLGLFAFTYAAFRVFCFHPVFNPRYMKWLSQTPWTYGKPLPNGPLLLVPQDAVVVGIMTLLHWLISPVNWAMTPAVFLTAHAVLIGLTLFYSRQFLQAYLLIFWFSGFLYVYQSTVLTGLLMVALSLVALWGIRDTLRSFHDWSSEKLGNNPFLQLNSEKAKEIQREKLLGWPYDRTGPIQASPNISLRWSAAIASLVGWWVFSVLFNFPIDPRTSYGFFMAILWCGSWIPTIICLSGYSSPISWWGRVRTGRWFIPGYDKVFLSPIVVTSVLILSMIIVGLFPEIYPVTMGLTTTACIFLSFLLTPDLTEWRLTGNHRIVAGVGFGQQNELQQTQ
ncbi:MAG: hypothetical protein HUJ26_23745 [Planctomycetaceae bacterium]|nr:hypothetical protein [Planctomycetaceae bacterium]